MEFIASFLASIGGILVQAPTYLAWLVGMGLAIARWQKHPQVSLLTLIALAANLALSIFTTIIYATLPAQFGSAQVAASAFQVIGVCNNLLHTVLWGLLLAAIFGWRKDE